MESAAILRRAAAQGIPALVVRAVSDTADETVPAALGRLVTPDGRVRAAQAVAALVTSRAVLRDALRLRRSTRRALGAVGAALGALAAAPRSSWAGPRRDRWPGPAGPERARLLAGNRSGW